MHAQDVLCYSVALDVGPWPTTGGSSAFNGLFGPWVLRWTPLCGAVAAAVLDGPGGVMTGETV